MRIRIDFKINGMDSVKAYDGETAWSFMPLTGKVDPEVLEDDQALNLVAQADIDGSLMSWKEKGHQVKLLGLAEIDGTKLFS